MVPPPSLHPRDLLGLLALASSLGGCSLGNYEFNGRAEAGPGDGAQDSTALEASDDASPEVSLDVLSERPADALPPDAPAPDAMVLDGGGPSCAFNATLPVTVTLRAPLSTSRTMGSTATLRWAPQGGTMDLVEVDSNRAFGTPLLRQMRSAPDLTSVDVPLTASSPPVLFWRVLRCMAGVAVAQSPVWSVQVGTRNGAGSSVRPGFLDVNNDGVGDLVVGESLDHRLLQLLGTARGVFGSATTIRSPDPTNTVAFGLVVAAAGDLNGDGYADVAVGTQQHAGTPMPPRPVGANTVWVFHGSSAGLEATPAATLTMPTGSSGADRFGAALAGVGDVDGDGFGDLVVGAPTADAMMPGAAWLYPGSRAGVSNGAAARLLSRPAGFGGAPQYGITVAGLGDTDGDGLSDFAVGASGRWALFQGAAGMAALSAWVAPVPNPDPGMSYGSSLGAAGDVDRDGLADVAVAAPLAGNTAGAVYLTARSAGSYTVRTPAVLLGSAGQQLGARLAGALDFDGDNADDVLVFSAGGPNATGTTVPSAGELYLPLVAGGTFLTLRAPDTSSVLRALAPVGFLGRQNMIASLSITAGGPGMSVLLQTFSCTSASCTGATPTFTAGTLDPDHTLGL